MQDSSRNEGSNLNESDDSVLGLSSEEEDQESLIRRSREELAAVAGTSSALRAGTDNLGLMAALFSLEKEL